MPNLTQHELLRMAALAAKWREPPRDALDTLVLTSADLASIEEYQQLDFMPFDPTVKRTEGTIKWVVLCGAAGASRGLCGVHCVAGWKKNGRKWTRQVQCSGTGAVRRGAA